MMRRIILGIVIGAVIGSVIGFFGKCSSGTCPLTSNPYSGALYGAILGLLLALMKQQQINMSEVWKDIDQIKVLKKKHMQEGEK